MIVVCPSCHQRYRHEFSTGGAAPVAHCSACDERFPLAPPKRTYLLAGAGVLSSLPGGPVITGGVPVSTGASTVSGVGVELPPSGGDLAGMDETRPQTAPRKGAMLESTVALLPGGVGAGLAYYYAGPMGQDPITWAALGGAIGLLLGWACLLWITRGD